MELKNSIIIAGPCAAESKEQLFLTAEQLYLTRLPISYFRTGVWKPRSSPKDFCGVGEIALEWLSQIKKQFHFPICVEVARGEHVQWCFEHGIDAIWIGARTTVNPFLVQEIADAVKQFPIQVMIKNPITPELKTWIGAIERIQEANAPKIICIHRGFSVESEHVLRYSPIWEIPIALKTHFPDLQIICDPSHISGNVNYLKEISQVALDYGFDGLMVEVHHDPQMALSDADQQITPSQFLKLIESLNFKSSVNLTTEHQLVKERNLIGHIDTQISELLKKRMEIVDEIAKIKNSHNLALLQPDQWKKVVQKYQQSALSDADYQKFLTDFLDLLHQASLNRQKNKH
jgi:chorismate mutase